MMKPPIVAVGFALVANIAQAESLCGNLDAPFIMDTLQGDWALNGSISVETETLSVVQPAQGGTATFEDDFVVALLSEDGLETYGTLAESPSPYDVDHVDDILETVEADWIADDLSLTPCGPEGLLQLRSSVQEPNRESHLTVLPYFNDQMLVIYEGELTGDWGLSFITFAALMTRDES